MTKVITYGTYDLIHMGHIRLLKRAKALGDYLIVGVTAEDFDKSRGKINVQQSLMERIEGVRATGLADEIIIEEYEGQKIDDIRRYDIDIFTVGSDWMGKFDYLEDYCKVVYLPRTEGVSSSEIRSKKRKLRIGFVGDASIVGKFANECQYVNGVETVGICTDNQALIQARSWPVVFPSDQYAHLLELVDAVCIVSLPRLHYGQIQQALLAGKHVLCESPIVLSLQEHREVYALAKKQHCILMDSIKTAFATAYSRLLLLIKSGKIGQIYSVDATCTSLQTMTKDSWNSICAWGPTAMLPVFNVLGTQYLDKTIYSHLDENGNDTFTKISFTYPHAVASIKVAQGVKSEGELILSGTKGYALIPAPWWKTDYFEIRFEDATENKRYFYPLEGEGIRYELVAFAKAIETGNDVSFVDQSVSQAISEVIADFYNRSGLVEL